MNGLILSNGMSDANLLSASTCGSAQSGNLIHYASGPAQVGAVGHDRIWSLMVHAESLLDIEDVCSALTLELVAQYILTVDTVDLGLGMGVLAVLDTWSCAGCNPSACTAGYVDPARHNEARSASLPLDVEQK